MEPTFRNKPVPERCQNFRNAVKHDSKSVHYRAIWKNHTTQIPNKNAVRFFGNVQYSHVTRSVGKHSDSLDQLFNYYQNALRTDLNADYREGCITLLHILWFSSNSGSLQLSMPQLIGRNINWSCPRQHIVKLQSKHVETRLSEHILQRINNDDTDKTFQPFSRCRWNGVTRCTYYIWVGQTHINFERCHTKM